MSFEIAGRKIGPNYPPLVIAELGINHEGSLATAFEMVDAAARAGVEVIKHQTHIVEDEMSGAAKNVIPGNANVSIYEIMERCSLNEADELELVAYATVDLAADSVEHFRHCATVAAVGHIRWLFVSQVFHTQRYTQAVSNKVTGSNIVVQHGVDT